MKSVFLLVCIALVWLCGSVHGRTWLVAKDGTGEVTTIQAGIDLATAGDTVLVGGGTYRGPVWLDHKSGICLRSETGRANCVTLLPDLSGNHYNAGIWCWDVDGTTEIEGFTVLNAGWSGDGGGFNFYSSAASVRNCEVTYVMTFAGTGVFCEGKYGAASPSITDCTFSHNVGYGLNGSIIYCEDSSPTITGCTFYDNVGWWGVVYCVGEASEPVITECTFMCNRSDTDAVGCADGATPWIERTIIAHNRGVERYTVPTPIASL